MDYTPKKELAQARFGLPPLIAWLPLWVAFLCLAWLCLSATRVEAQDALSPTRNFDDYSFEGCGTYRWTHSGDPTLPYYGEPIIDYHVCTISQIDNLTHEHRICFTLRQISTENTNIRKGVNSQGAYYTLYSQQLSLTTRLIEGVEGIGGHDLFVKTVACATPRSSSFVRGLYDEITLVCTFDTGDTDTIRESLVEPGSSAYAQSCHIRAEFENPVRPFMAPEGYSQVNHYGRLTGCNRLTSSSGSFLHCKSLVGAIGFEVSIERSICIIDQATRYAGFNRNTYHARLDLRRTSVSYGPGRTTECYPFSVSASQSYVFYARCTKLDSIAQGILRIALEDAKCWLVVYFQDFSSSTTPTNPAGPGEEGGPSVPPGTPFHEAVGRSCGDSGNPQVDDCEFLDTIDSILKWLAWITVPIIVIVIIYAGIQMSMAGGNSQAFQAAKNRITQAIIALICFIALWSFVWWLTP